MHSTKQAMICKATIEANSTTLVTRFAGLPGEEFKLTNLTVDSNPDADVEFQKVYGWREVSNEDGKQAVKINETAGTSFDLSWELHKRPAED
ncbi:hypothetical protein [Haloarcula salinisoli]|uniref:Uncharacterized protein n=1 Tax=Haloarcula salinisoli TaxID=2487746 RepID=A0A8J8C715_9EURY|nr:hypothetical protein [Halomicroarcula salinisoli]MBX0285695.1 hypothetical protein [Halomicroarcula salinisoli]MBX0302817.1 hypothetical protein [Halomicroarcula salinisoli]